MKAIFIGGRPMTNLTHMKRYDLIKKPVGTLNPKQTKDPYVMPEYIYIGSLGREMYSVINDAGYEMLYPKKCFMTEQEFRERKLNQILE